MQRLAAIIATLGLALMVLGQGLEGLAGKELAQAIALQYAPKAQAPEAGYPLWFDDCGIIFATDTAGHQIIADITSGFRATYNPAALTWTINGSEIPIKNPHIAKSTATTTWQVFTPEAKPKSRIILVVGK